MFFASNILSSPIHVQAYVTASKLMKHDIEQPSAFKEVAQMNEALCKLRITIFFLAYVVIVLNVKRRLGMFETPHAKNPISGSDPKQGAAYNFVLNYFLEGVIKDGIEIEGAHADNDLNFECAKEMIEARTGSLECFEKLTGALKFTYKKSLLKHFGAKDDRSEEVAEDDEAVEDEKEKNKRQLRR